MEKNFLLLAIVSVVAIVAIIFMSISMSAQISGLASKNLYPPTPIQLIGPSNGALDVSATPTFSWTTTKRADYINLYIDDEPTMATPLVYDHELKKNANEFILPSGVLQPGKTYYWRVEAQNSVDATDSPVYSFTTAP